MKHLNDLLFTTEKDGAFGVWWRMEEHVARGMIERIFWWCVRVCETPNLVDFYEVV